MTYRSVLLRLMMIGCLLTAVGFASTITNPSFEIGAYGQIITFNGSDFGGPSAATGWYIQNNTEGSTATELCTAGSCPSGAPTPPVPADGTYDIHVMSNGPYNGIFQFFSDFTANTAGVYLNIVTGPVMFGVIGSDSSFNYGIFTSSGLATLNFGPAPIEEIVLYGIGNVDGTSNFYADAVTLANTNTGVPEPTTLLLGLGGLLTVIGVARRRTSKS